MNVRAAIKRGAGLEEIAMRSIEIKCSKCGAHAFFETTRRETPTREACKNLCRSNGWTITDAPSLMELDDQRCPKCVEVAA